MPIIIALFVSLLMLAVPVSAMERLDDDTLEEVSGAGFSFGLDDFEFAMDPHSYFEQVGSAPVAGLACTATGQNAGNYNCWRRGDLRWYGINMSAASGSGGYHWDDATACNANSLNCPRGGVIDQFSPYDNPYMLRAGSSAGMGYDGVCINGSVGGCSGTPTQKAMYEFLAPSKQPDYTFSWWGEIESGSTRNSATQALATNAGRVLKSQNIIRGNAAGSIFRIFQFTESGNETFALFYHSYLRGDYRLSTAQTTASANNTIGAPVVFADTEGLYFRKVEAFVPLGQLYYQALLLKQIGTGGNFELSLNPLPNNATVYNFHYAKNTGDTTGFETARLNNTGGALTNEAQYDLTHGYSRWGAWTASGTWLGRNLINGNDGSSTGDGVIFQACSGCANFLAFAKRPTVIDKRGETGSMQLTQNYTCNTGNTGVNCNPNFNNAPAANPYGGPIVSGRGDFTRTYPTKTVNLGDARIEGLMFNYMRVVSCGGVQACTAN